MFTLLKLFEYERDWSRFWFLSRFCLNAEGRKISIFRSARASSIGLKKQANIAATSLKLHNPPNNTVITSTNQSDKMSIFVVIM